jgi:hypothetical protein
MSADRDRIADRLAEEELGSVDRSSWAPVDLAAVLANQDGLESPPAILARNDGEFLLYRGKVHWFAGEPETAKGWLAAAATSEEIRAGEHVLWADFEDEASTLVSRLGVLGHPPEEIVERFHYLRPDEPMTDAGRGELEQVLEEFRPSLGVIDGMTDALALEGIDLRDNTEVATWMRGLPMMLRDRGMAVVICDHVIKDSESRGRWSIGAQHKLAKTDVQYRLKVEEPLGRGLVGRVLIRVEKDRPGHLRAMANGKTVAELIADASVEGKMRLSLQPVDAEDTGAFRPTGYMEKVSRTCEAEPGLSLRKVRAAVGGKATYVDQAIEVLVHEEYLEVRPQGQAQCHYVIRAYREAEDSNRVPDRVPTVSPEPLGEHSGDRVPVSPPIGDTGHGPGDTVSQERVPNLESLSVHLTAGVDGNDRPAPAADEARREAWKARHRE